jgi:hypothetical protein
MPIHAKTIAALLVGHQKQNIRLFRGHASSIPAGLPNRKPPKNGRDFPTAVE